MNRIFFLNFISALFLFSCTQTEQSQFDIKDYANYPSYNGKDLGLTYTPEQSIFKVWSPVASKMRLLVYNKDIGGTPASTHSMSMEHGVWQTTIKSDLKGKYYSFQAYIDTAWSKEVPDPYVKAVGTNGLRGQVVDMKETNPEGWENDESPELKSKTDAILYELHIRDFSISPNSGMKNKGKYLAFAETGTTVSKGIATGIDHIKDLGVTHVHLLPTFDFYSVNEAKLNEPQFNWGYDPQNYNVPEGSFSTDPSNGTLRIKEFKTMVKALHDNGLRVVMDVVYNHTGKTSESNFSQLVPHYYYRQNEEGGYSNGSWCGNETASERAMVRKFFVESLVYWSKEYHIDGFRFDLMGNHDIETMNLISKELHAIDSTVFIYGEGWGGDPKTMADSLRAIKVNASQLDRIAVFSDDMRDGIKGHVFEEKKNGYVSGLPNQEESIKFGVVASTLHEQVDYSKVFYARAPFANEPHQTINYCSAHDNHTLWDKLEVSMPDASEEDRIRMHKLANTIVLTSQGVPFLHAGVEFLRTKHHEHNSYKSPDSINQLNWSFKEKNMQVYTYYQQLISLRKAHSAFRMPTTTMIQKHLSFLNGEEGVVVFQLSENANGDAWKNILVVYNGANSNKKIELPEGKWNFAVMDGEFVEAERVEGKVEIKKYTAHILYQE